MNKLDNFIRWLFGDVMTPFLGITATIAIVVGFLLQGLRELLPRFMYEFGVAAFIAIITLDLVYVFTGFLVGGIYLLLGKGNRSS